MQVLRRIAEGLSNREIGEQLGISESTVKTHVNHLLELGLSESAVKARVNGLLGIADRVR